MGTRTDIKRPRLHSPNLQGILRKPHILYLGNNSPPPWIRIFRSIKSTSRRTQAAAIAYMFPHCLGATNMSVKLCHLTARNRTCKLDSTMVNVCCPPEFCNAAAEHTKAFDRKVALVCDGGCDHNIPSSPPSNKVSIIVLIDPPPIACTHTVVYLPLGQYIFLENFKSSQRPIFSRATNISFNGDISSRPPWLPSIHINSKDVRTGYSPQERNAEIV